MHEIIHVVDPASLTEPVRHALEIEAVSDHPLAAGYYFVLWQAARPQARSKRYFGPFASRAEARLLQRSALALGLIRDERVIQSIAECRSIVRPPPAAPGASRPHMPPRHDQAAWAAA